MARRRKPRAGRFGNRRTNRPVGPGRPRSYAPGPLTPQTPGERSADRTIGPYWRAHGRPPLITDKPAGGGGGGGAGQAVLGPPPGTYDPQLDASVRAADRGLRDFMFDTQRAGTHALEDYGIARDDATINLGRGRADLGSTLTRAIEDYGIGKGDVGREYSRGLFDLTQDRDRGLQDIGTQRGDTRGDFDRSLAELNRRYEFQGHAQDQQARAAGVMEGGYAEQAAQKRAANLAFDRQPLDTSLSRALRDLDTAQGRLTSDYGTSATRLGENRDRAMLGLGVGARRTGEDVGTQRGRLEQDYGRLLGTPGSPRSGLLFQGYQRGVEDRATGSQRAQRENREFGQDVMGSRYYQARYGAGTLPIWRPRTGGPRRRDPYAPPRRRR